MELTQRPLAPHRIPRKEDKELCSHHLSPTHTTSLEEASGCIITWTLPLEQGALRPPLLPLETRRSCCHCLQDEFSRALASLCHQVHVTSQAETQYTRSLPFQPL